MSYDTVLSELGEFGPYQRRVYLLLCVISIPIAHHACSVIFNTQQPDFRCAVPGLANDSYVIQNEAHRLLVNSSIPYNDESGTFSQCSAYKNHPRVGSSNDTPSTVVCNMWVYEPEVALTSLVPNLNIVCDRKIYSKHFAMMIMLGGLIGSFIGGPLADRFGRKKIAIGFTVLQAVTGTSFAFVTTVPAVMALRLIISFLGMMLFMSIFVLLTEIVGPSKRTIATMGIMFSWVVGMFTLTLICYLIPDWRIAQIVISAPGMLAVLAWWHIPESPRWLLIRNRHEEAKAIIRTMAKVNMVALPDELDTMLMSEDSQEKRDEPPKIWHLFTNRILFTRVAILAFSWCSTSMVYYGLTLNVGDMVEGSLYTNFALQGVMEFLAYLILISFMEKVGRKKLYCGSILLSGLACLATAGPVFAGSEIEWINSALYCIGKFGITAAFALIYIVTAELLPTVVRNSGLGLCSFIGRIAGVSSPYIASLGTFISGTFGEAAPLLLFGIFSIIAGLTSLMLPETRNRELPEIIDDMKNFSRSKKKELNVQEAC